LQKYQFNFFIKTCINDALRVNCELELLIVTDYGGHFSASLEIITRLTIERYFEKSTTIPSKQMYIYTWESITPLE